MGTHISLLFSCFALMLVCCLLCPYVAALKNPVHRVPQPAVALCVDVAPPTVSLASVAHCGLCT